MTLVHDVFDMNDMIDDLNTKYESSEMDEDLYKDTLDAIAANATDNLESLSNWYRNVSNLNDNYKKAISDLKDKMAANAKKLAFIDGLTLKTLDKLGVKKYQAGLNTLTTSSSKRVMIDEDAVIPDEYMNVKVASIPDKKKLKDALKDGQAIKGVHIDEFKNLKIK